MKPSGGSGGRRDAAFITKVTIGTVPRHDLLIACFGRSNSFSGGSTPDEAFGIWPDPVWRVEDLEDVERRPGEAQTHRRVRFKSGTIVALEPSWRWFGPQGRQIEEIALVTLALSPATLRAAAALEGPRPTGLADPPHDGSSGHLVDAIRQGIFRALTEKARIEDPQAGAEHPLAGGCHHVWELVHPGWVAAELITAAAMQATLDDRFSDEEREAQIAPWRNLVGTRAPILHQLPRPQTPDPGNTASRSGSRLPLPL
jgi:hypothetical protein